MKKIILSLFALLTMLTTFAQSDWGNQPKLFDQYWMIGLQSGFAQFNGDLSNKSFFGKLKKESKSSFGISLSRQFSPVLSFKAEVSNSNYFSANRLHWQDPVNFTDLSVTGNITEFGLYGTLNLNKLFSKDKEKVDNWNAYLSSGIGFANWRCKLKNEDNYSIVDKIGYNDTVKFFKPTNIALSIPLTLGVNFQVTDGIWISVEHSIHFVNSDYVDAYNDQGSRDRYSTTTLGVTVKLQKLSALLTKKNADNPSAVSTSPKETVKPERAVRSSRRMPKSKPELQEYTGYNGLLPPSLPKVDTTRKTKIVGDQKKDDLKAETDSGRFEITGGKTNINTEFLTDNKAVTGLVPSYRIQVQASKVYIPVNTVTQKDALTDKISVELRPDGWYRYYLGQFSTLSEAKAKLLEMQNKGIKDAFIVSFKKSVRKEVNKKK